MADLGAEFDSRNVAPNTGDRDPVPAGRYLAAIINSDMKPTKDGTGTFLELELEILEGEHKGRKVFDRLNLRNKNPQAEAIAQGTLSAICHAVNVMQVRDSAALHNKPMHVTVAVEQRKDDTTKLSNNVKKYEGRNVTAAPTQAPAGNAPWKKS
jgi:hypothetical protein